MDAQQLLVDAHGRCSRMLAAAANQHLEGLAQVSRCKRLALSPRTRRGFRELDLVAPWVRHAIAPRMAMLIEEMTNALAAADNVDDVVEEEEEVGTPVFFVQQGKRKQLLGSYGIFSPRFLLIGEFFCLHVFGHFVGEFFCLHGFAHFVGEFLCLHGFGHFVEI